MTNYKIKKSQIFLTKKKIIKNITQNLNNNYINIEIGPGYGNLTDFLIKKIRKLYIIEIDKKITKFLKKKYKKKIIILNKNILKIKKIKKKFNIFGSLPYKITNKIFFLLIKNIKYLKEQNLIIQEEFYNNKIKNKKNFFYYLMKFNYKIKNKIKIKKNSFFPKPKINSIFIKMIKLKKDYKFRKLINNNIKKIFLYKSKKFFNFFKKKQKNIDNFIFYSLYYIKENKISINQ